MSKYLEISSLNRDRIRYPNPTNFNIHFKQYVNNSTKSLRVESSLSNAYPIYNFTMLIPNHANPLSVPISNALGTFGGTVNINPHGAGTSSQPKLPDHFSNIDDYYAGMIIKIGSDNLGGAPPLESTRILTYHGDTREATLERSLYKFKPQAAFTIMNDAKKTVDINNNCIYKELTIHGGENICNYYAGMYVEDVDYGTNTSPSDQLSGLFSKIISYNDITHIAKLEHALNCVAIAQPQPPWRGNRYRIRHELPLSQGWKDHSGIGYDNLVGPAASNCGKNGSIIDFTIVDGGNGYSITGDDKYLQGTAGSGNLLSVEIIRLGTNGKILELTITNPGHSYSLGDVIDLNNNPIVAGSGAKIKVTRTGQYIPLIPDGEEFDTFIGPNGLFKNFVTNGINTNSGYYDGELFYIPNNRDNLEGNGVESINIINIPPYQNQLTPRLKTNDTLIPNSVCTTGVLNNQEHLDDTSKPTITSSAKILRYTTGKYYDNTNLLKGLSLFIVVPTNSYIFPTPWGTPFTGLSWEIQQFTSSGDGYYDIESTILHPYHTLHKIKLLNIMLPNKCMKSYVGGRLSTYPMIYVELYNTSSQHDNIYSNNHDIKNALFQCAMVDVNELHKSKFIKLTGNGQTHNIRFSPTDNLHFRVFFSNGNDIEYDIYDTVSPTYPDMSLQVTAFFEISQ
jgi:hypothetical protein